MKLTPREPTPEMVEAAKFLAFTSPAGFAEMWRAMHDAAPSAEPVADKPGALDVCLDEEATRLLHDTMVPEPGEVSAIRLQVGEGHDGHGLYVSLAEYPEEGSIFLASVATRPAPAPAKSGEYPPLPDEDWRTYTADQMRAYVDADRAQRVPLTEEAILMEGLMMTPSKVLDNCGDAFTAGVRYAERAHGIGAKP